MSNKYFNTCIVVMIVIGAMGCSNQVDSAETTGPYASDIREALEGATDFERTVLEDGQITESEYLEGQSLYVSCLKDRGYRASAEGFNQGYTLHFDIENPLAKQAVMECETGTIKKLEPLFYAMRDNPKKQDMSEVYAECMVRVGAAPAGFVGADLLLLWDMESSGDQEVTIDDTDSGSATFEVFPEDIIHKESPVIPGGKSLDSIEVQQCYVNPQGG